MADEKTLKQSIDEMMTFCKKKGFVYQNSEIYGGYSGFFDYGPFGSELKNNIKQQFWKTFVHERDDMVAIDGTIITHPKVWEASGHAAGFGDLLVDCKKCNNQHRADHLIADILKIQTDGITKEQSDKLIRENNIRCQKCGGELGDVRKFLLMFTTQVGPVLNTSSMAYLRPETAQVIFADFKLVQENARMKLPFGILQIGKAFRNEISPRNFLFRLREFEQMEIEFFVDPRKVKHCPYFEEIKNRKINVWTQKNQKEEKDHQLMSMKELIDSGEIKSEWHAYWLVQVYDWFARIGCNPDNFRIRVHLNEELAHYAAACADLEYKYPFGWSELHGMADRTTFDLDQHIKHSGKDMSYFDEETKEKVVPHVIEPSQGVDRAFLAVLFDAYKDDKERGNIVLKLHPRIAPIKAAIFPLVTKDGLAEKATAIHKELKKYFNVLYDKSGSVGRRYARADELGIPFCITIDYDSLKDEAITIRDRDSSAQKRVKISELKSILRDLVDGEKTFDKI